MGIAIVTSAAVMLGESLSQDVRVIIAEYITYVGVVGGPSGGIVHESENRLERGAWGMRRHRVGVVVVLRLLRLPRKTISVTLSGVANNRGGICHVEGAAVVEVLRDAVVR